MGDVSHVNMPDSILRQDYNDYSLRLCKNIRNTCLLPALGSDPSLYVRSVNLRAACRHQLQHFHGHLQQEALPVVRLHRQHQVRIQMLHQHFSWPVCLRCFSLICFHTIVRNEDLWTAFRDHWRSINLAVLFLIDLVYHNNDDYCRVWWHLPLYNLRSFCEYHRCTVGHLPHFSLSALSRLNIPTRFQRAKSHEPAF